MKKIILFSTFPLLTACATLNDSMLLGAGIGTITAGIATSTASQSIGKTATADEMTTNASIGMAIGLISAFLIHENTRELRRDSYYQMPEIYFGDLPPSPFIMTPSEKKGRK